MTRFKIYTFTKGKKKKKKKGNYPTTEWLSGGHTLYSFCDLTANMFTGSDISNQIVRCRSSCNGYKHQISWEMDRWNSRSTNHHNYPSFSRMACSVLAFSRARRLSVQRPRWGSLLTNDLYYSCLIIMGEQWREPSFPARQ